MTRRLTGGRTSSYLYVTDEKGDLVFMPRDDKRFMKTSIATYDPETEEPVVTYREFNHSYIKPRLRNYAVAKKE